MASKLQRYTTDEVWMKGQPHEWVKADDAEKRIAELEARLHAIKERWPRVLDHRDAVARSEAVDEIDDWIMGPGSRYLSNGGASRRRPMASDLQRYLHGDESPWADDVGEWVKADDAEKRIAELEQFIEKQAAEWLAQRERIAELERERDEASAGGA